MSWSLQSQRWPREESSPWLTMNDSRLNEKGKDDSDSSLTQLHQRIDESQQWHHEVHDKHSLQLQSHSHDDLLMLKSRQMETGDHEDNPCECITTTTTTAGYKTEMVCSFAETPSASSEKKNQILISVYMNLPLQLMYFNILHSMMCIKLMLRWINPFRSLHFVY